MSSAHNGVPVYHQSSPAPKFPRQNHMSTDHEESRREHRRHGSSSAFPLSQQKVPSSSITHNTDKDNIVYGYAPPKETSFRYDGISHSQPQAHVQTHRSGLPPFANLQHSDGSPFEAENRLTTHSLSQSPTRMDLRIQLPRAWSPSAGVRHINEPYYAQSSIHVRCPNLPAPPSGHDLMAMFPAPSPAANIQYQQVSDVASQTTSLSSDSSLASPPSVSSKEIDCGSEGPDLKAMRAVPVPVPGSTFFARQESLYFSQRHHLEKTQLSQHSSHGNHAQPFNADESGFSVQQTSNRPCTNTPPTRPASTHPYAHGHSGDYRLEDRLRRCGDGDVRMVMGHHPPPPPRPHSTVTVEPPPPHHKYHHSFHPAPVHDSSHARSMPPPMSEHLRAQSMANPEWPGPDDEGMRRRSGKHTRRVFIQ